MGPRKTGRRRGGSRPWLRRRLKFGIRPHVASVRQAMAAVAETGLLCADLRRGDVAATPRVVILGCTIVVAGLLIGLSCLAFLVGVFASANASSVSVRAFVWVWRPGIAIGRPALAYLAPRPVVVTLALGCKLVSGNCMSR